MTGMLPMPIVCTDRGRHKRTLLSAQMSGISPPDARPGDPVTAVRGLWRIQRCPRCGRDTNIRAEKLAEVWPRLVAAGFTELDISRLPF